MNTCYCLRLTHPHPRNHLCEIHRLDRMIQRRDFERRVYAEDDWELDQDDDYKRQDWRARNVGKKV